jgi:soluble lytic murein transglycosylase
MPRQALIVLAPVVVLAAALLLLMPRPSGPAAPSGEEEVAGRVAGDVTEAVEGLDPSAMPAEAEALLSTDRPWRAARVMRRYLEQVSDPPLTHRLLAARAEAGWGAWHEVHALLEGTPGLDAHEGGIGLYLLGRARDAQGDATGAVEAYRAFLALPGDALEMEQAVARLRLGLVLIRAGDRAAARTQLAGTREYAGQAGVWMDLLEADALAQTGDQAAVRQAVAAHTSGVMGLRAWRARIAAARAANDLASARRLAVEARNWAGTDATRAEFFLEEGRLALELGDTAAGRTALRGAIARDPASGYAAEASDLLQEGDMTAADHLAVARVYRARGLHEESLDGYRRWLGSGQGAAGERQRVQMELANALFYAERYDEVEQALQPLGATVPARMLRARAEAHRGNTDAAVRIYLDLAEQRAGADNGAMALYLAGDVTHAAGDARGARTYYERVISRHAGASQAGLSMMRLAGIDYLDGNHAAAARRWDAYRQQFPRGTHALQSLYWSARAHEAMGQAETARNLYRQVRQRERDGYYALLASERLGESFWPIPMGASPAESPEASRRVAGWMRGVDLLHAAGFPDEASAEADRVVSRAGSDRATLYALAEALAERGYSQRAIRLGLGLQRAGQNPRLMRILYPFPYRTLIQEEARDRGLDPYLTPALIRQESMFEARIQSHVGARGLMQIMPGTGRRLAEAVGIEPFDPEVLYHPEINVHLGTRYVAQHWENYDGSLPSIFSAYNAGAHRVGWWSEYPEYGDDELFTERIPFRETRDYVKILTRNHAIYRGLYGAGS